MEKLNKKLSMKLSHKYFPPIICGKKVTISTKKLRIPQKSYEFFEKVTNSWISAKKLRIPQKSYDFCEIVTNSPKKLRIPQKSY